ncbi:MAG: phosphatase PAP2 family protein [Thermoactinospora sp.]|nr:phosphatase PAP2 family protein [Thermoactinospora sp.]
MSVQAEDGRDLTAPARPGPADRVARWTTELFAPQVLVIAMPPVVGLIAEGWAGASWGLLASALCGGIPAAVIAVGVRLGRLDSRHLVDRAKRTKPLLAAVVSVVLALVLLVVLGAPDLLVATVTGMLAALAVAVPVTLWWKISFHAAVAAGTAVVFAHVLPPAPTAAVAAALLVLICWARVRLTHHTPAQVLAGLAVGMATTWGSLAAFGI